MERIVTWKQLNDILRGTKKEDEVLAILKAEQANEKRPRFIKRIWSRYSVLRKKREKKELAIEQ